MVFTEQLLNSYLLNFLCIITILYCLRWFRDYLPLPAGVAVALIFALVPTNQNLITSDALVFRSVCSILTGLTIGLPLGLALELLPFSGRLMDISRGMQFAEINLGASRGSILEGLMDLFIPVCFFKLELHFLLFEKFLAMQERVYHSIDSNSFLILINLISEGLKAGVNLALPILILCFSVDLISILAARMLSAVNLPLELTPLKSLLGLFALYTGSEYYQEHIYGFLRGLSVFK